MDDHNKNKNCSPASLGFRFDPNPEVWVKAESSRIITKLFKHYLGALEDLRYQHEVALDRLKDKLSPQEMRNKNARKQSVITNDH